MVGRTDKTPSGGVKQTDGEVPTLATALAGIETRVQSRQQILIYLFTASAIQQHLSITKLQQPAMT